MSPRLFLALRRAFKRRQITSPAAYVDSTGTIRFLPYCPIDRDLPGWRFIPKTHTS